MRGDGRGIKNSRDYDFKKLIDKFSLEIEERKYFWKIHASENNP